MDKLIDGLIDKKSNTFLSSFSNVNIRENRDIYKNVVNQTKDIINNSLELARLRLENGEYKGSECAEQISHLYDFIIKSYFEYLSSSSDSSQNKTDFEKIAILATGGYGRGKIAPDSDIDLLFLMPFKKTAWSETITENLLYFLWDLGLKIGHATRNINECISLSLQDQTITTSLLDARFICGDEEVAKVFEKSFRQSISKRSSNDFIKIKLEERESRHIKEGQSRYLVEPNIKNSKGGLRDLESLSWMTNFCYEAARPSQMIKKDILSNEEAAIFRRCENFLWHVRCQLHFLEKSSNDTINFNAQVNMADKLGYLERKGLKPVERFMKHYFLVAKEVGDLTRSVCHILEEKHRVSFVPISLFRKILELPSKLISSGGGIGFFVTKGRLNITNNNVFKKDPHKIILFFFLMSKNNLSAHPSAIRVIRKSLKLIDHRLRNNIKTNKLFIDLLANSNAETTLRSMNETGVLGKFIPDFGQIVGLMQFNMYHHYTADEHLIKAVGELNKIFFSKNKEYQILNNLILNDEEKRILILAIFFHDIAKGREGDHSEEGKKVVKKMAKRLCLSEKEEETISWLVLDHLKMSDFAQRRDIQDPVTIKDFAEIIQTTKRLKLLLFLTVADIRAVGPGVWNDWKGELLKNLYDETYLALTGNFSEQERKNKVLLIKNEVNKALPNLNNKLKQSLIDNLDDSYWLSVPADIQKRNLIYLSQGLKNKEKEIIDVYNNDQASSTILTIYTKDKPRLFQRISAGCLDLGISIVDARIFSNKDDSVLDILWIQDTFSKKITDGSRLARLKERILEFITDKNIPSIKINYKLDKRVTAFDVAPYVEIDNSLSDRFSVIEVSGKDRPGLLYNLTKSLSDMNINIRSAHIATFGERATDVFYVLSQNGEKVFSRKKINSIKDELTKSIIITDNV